ncbi:prepilin-type N-terminal cleavage/methylation domain-containing protein [Moritella sp. Urea-trap-13]|uniref:prepilin-type N-terminal cleavage/methylation domain-containing protein n=1 Tax=Moritella sp. Urea-trap-13 TaxID=2058327 RepID=UPI000C32B7D4|nr:prepilin-type N-terminal cleavage/methylation domain-containing protein [Moritella sp. Urea-trap-13]PKH09364.1 MSHA biogenesis protein MshA [Moritella sp. Urea-trap-13]
MHKNKGFTLIELVIVIIILGILSATAIPKFLNIGIDAKNATLQSMQGALNDAIELSYAKLAIHGKETASILTGKDAGKIIAGCDDCIFYYGRPQLDIKTLSVLIDGINPDNDGDFVLTNPITQRPSSGNIFNAYITLPENMDSSGNIIDLSCYIKYSQGAYSATVAKPELTFKECK